MMIWKTQDAMPAGFAAAWDAVIRPSAHSHFALELPWLEWEAAHGRHSIAVVDAGGSAPMAVAARRERGALISGWPWRWQVARTGEPDALLEGLSADDAQRAERWMVECGGGARVRLHLPLPTRAGHPATRSGFTTLAPLAPGAGAKPMSGNKRREARKAAEAGWTVAPAVTHEEFRRFAELQRATERERGRAAAALPDRPAAGEGWREWEHPWMWLLLARRDGVIGAGSGFGRSAGGMVDYRTNASTPEAKAAGANALLAVEALRLAAAAGHTYMNWGGATTFKRSLGGDTLPVWQWLGGGGAWAVPNALESLWKNARSEAAAGVKALRRGGRSRRR